MGCVARTTAALVRGTSVVCFSHAVKEKGQRRQSGGKADKLFRSGVCLYPLHAWFRTQAQPVDFQSGDKILFSQQSSQKRRGLHLNFSLVAQ